MIDAEELKEELDLEFFFDRESLAHKIGRGVSGMQINAKECPACGDSRWRVYLNLETGAGNCFVCNERFSKLSFLRHTWGLKENEWAVVFRQARELLVEQGWRPKRTVTAAVEQGAIVLPQSTPLPIDGQNLTYLEQRGITAELAAYFHLRYCQFGYWKFIDEDTGKPKLQSFENRLIIPVFDLDGTLVTFQGRDLGGTSDRKYLFPKAIAGTGRFLLNGQNVMLTKEVCMGEGAFDVMAMKLAFDADPTMRHIVPVGSFGKHLSYGSTDGNDQFGRFIKLKAAGIRQVTTMWDGEPKALIAALNAAKLLHGLGLIVRIALLPADKDPNEVPGYVVRDAYKAAQLWSPALDVKWRLRNPYRAAGA